MSNIITRFSQCFLALFLHLYILLYLLFFKWIISFGHIQLTLYLHLFILHCLKQLRDCFSVFSSLLFLPLYDLIFVLNSINMLSYLFLLLLYLGILLLSVLKCCLSVRSLLFFHSTQLLLQCLRNLFLSIKFLNWNVVLNLFKLLFERINILLKFYRVLFRLF